MNLDSAKQAFDQEATELLEAMEDALLSLEQSPDDEDLVHQVFRAMHTIKGTAGVFGFDAIVHFTHKVESVMDDVRSGERSLDAELIATLLDCKDYTANLVEKVLAEGEDYQPDEEMQALGDALIAQLSSDEEQQVVVAEAQASPVEVESLPVVQDGDYWVISLDFKQDALRNGMDPLSFIRYLGTLGEIVQIYTVNDYLPELEKFDAESCYLSFRIFFKSDADKKAIEGVFEFAEDDCEISILPPRSEVEHYLAALESLSDDKVQRIGDLLVAAGALTEKEVENALQAQLDSAQSAAKPEGVAESARLGEILVEQKAVQRKVVDAALKKQEKQGQESRYIRVDADRLGHLINLVGELVINSAAMKVMVQRHGLDDVHDVVDSVDQLVEEIRDNALQLRMVQIGDTFSRFRRVVRDVSKDLGKQIELQISGGETELDKTVVEKINDPLTHLIRNALDHGIETPEQRLAAGKAAQGTVALHAYHDSGHIVIEIRDDGKGLDAEVIRAKAEAKGLVKPEQSLSREEILRLIFEPGLSTKDQASNLSGRGVGMDVVRRNIEALRGTVELDSEPGQGTTITIVLPLTLAIIDGFLVGTGAEQYVIPLAQVVECVEIDEDNDVHQQGHHYINLRGEVLPYLRLKDFFSIHRDHVQERESLVVVRFGHHKAGLVVDELFGELQTVIKPLGQIFEKLKGVAGATVLGTGDIALILDVQELTALMHGSSQMKAAQLVH